MTGKALVKGLIGSVAASQPMRPIMRSVLRPRSNLVYYHFVGKTDPFFKEFSGNCSLQRFEQDLLRLKSYFELVPLQKVLEINSRGEVPDHPVLAVTFDDGFNLVRGGVMEVLDRYDVKATAFLITACIDNQNMMWRNKISAIMNTLPAETLIATYNEVVGASLGETVKSVREILAASMRWPMAKKEGLADALWSASGMVPLAQYLAEYQPYMTWDDLDVWRSHGHEIGLHTHSHPVCAELDDDLVREEIIAPAAFLKKRLDLDVLPFSYPFGVRLPADKESRILDDDTLQCALGIQGSVPFDPLQRCLERADIEESMAFSLFGKALINAVRRQ